MSSRPPTHPYRRKVDHLAASGFAGFATFAIWWELALIIIPWADDRLTWAHVAFAVAGAPICAWLAVVAWRLVRAAARDRPM